MMNKSFFSATKFAVVLLTFFFSVSTQAQIVNSESFDDVTFLPVGWSQIGSASNWGRVSTLLAPLSGGTHSGAGMARMRYPVGGSATSYTEAIATPSFSLLARGTNTPTVSFWIYRDSLLLTNYDSLAVYINTSLSMTGATRLGAVARNRSFNLPNVKASNGWYQYTFNVPVGFNSATNYLIFQGTLFGPQAASRRLYIDDVNWDAFPVLCSGTPLAGNIYTSDSLICGGANSANLILNNGSADAGISHQWYIANSPTGPWSSFGTNATNVTTSTLSSTSYFICTSTCSYSSGIATSPVKQVVVNTGPSPVVSIVVSSDTICKNTPVILTATGASSYTWTNSSNTTIGTTNSLTMTPLSTTTYNVVGKDAFGCASSQVQQTITVINNPTILSLTSSAVSICPGVSVNLVVQASGAGSLSYFWSPTSQTSSSINVTPTTTTVYTVTVSGQYACTATSNITVNVSPTLGGPAITMNQPQINICEGTIGSQTITVQTTVPNVTYAWSSSLGVPINVNSNTLLVSNPSATTTYTVTVSDPATGCSSLATSVLNIRPIPTTTLTSPNTTICAGGSSLIDVAIGNTGGDLPATYTCAWTPSGLTGSTVSVSPTQTGYQYVVVTSQYNCSKLDSLLITVNSSQQGPVLTLSSNVSVLCDTTFNDVQLVANYDSPTATYSWSPQITSTNDTIIVNPTTTTTYSVMVTDGAGCSTSASTTVFVSTSPVASFNYVLGPNNSVFLTSTSQNVASYHWTFGDGASSILANPSHVYATSGSFIVTLVVTNAGGCTDTLIQEVFVNLTGIEESQFTRFDVYPNPSEGVFNLQFNSAFSGGNLVVLNLVGEKVFASQISENTKNTQIDLTALPTGVYCIQLENLTQSTIRRIVKK